MMNLCRNKLSLLMGATAVLGAATVVPASAQTIPLAGFTQSQPGTPFTYTANPGAANATFSASTLVDFTFLNAAAFGAPGTTFLGATLTLTGNAADIATPSGANGTQAVTITGLTIMSGSTLLLGMTSADAGVGFFPIQPQLGGLLGSTSSGIQASTTGPFPAVITYSSDVATIGPGDRDFSISLNSMTTPLAIGGDLDFVSFNSSIAGVFGATAGVPEPGSMGMLIGIGVTGTAVMFRRRRRA